MSESLNNTYLAIDVGGTAIKYSIMDENAEILKFDEIESKNENEEELYCALDEIILPCLDRINGIAISFPGRINVNEGIVHIAGSFKWIHDLALKSKLEERYSKKVWIENDGKCSALAEYWKGNLSDTENGVTMGLGTGIAGGIILNGKPYRGINGSSGEFSSILVNYKDSPKPKRLHHVGGYRGLINQYANAKGLSASDVDTHKFFKDCHDCDEIAIAVLKDYAKLISIAIFNIQCVLDVEKFCIGGGISSQDILINEIKDNVHNLFPNPTAIGIKEPKIERCLFGNMAGCVGALYNFLINENII